MDRQDCDRGGSNSMMPSALIHSISTHPPVGTSWSTAVQSVVAAPFTFLLLSLVSLHPVKAVTPVTLVCPSIATRCPWRCAICGRSKPRALGSF